MPRSLSVGEREKITVNLKRAASECLSVYGARKTTVDMLVQKAAVPKGSFYLFYKSKELLFWEVINDYHRDISAVMKSAASEKGAMNAELFTEVLWNIFVTVSQSFYPSLMAPGEMESIMRRLPDDVVAKHHNDDADMLTELASILPENSPVFKDRQKLEAVSGALRILFFSLLHRREIGESLFDSSLKMLIRGIAAELFSSSYGEVSK